MRACALIVALWLALPFVEEALPAQANRQGLTFAPIADPVREGQALAERLRRAAPNAEAEFRGSLLLMRGSKLLERAPISSRLVVGPTHWQMIYETDATTNRPAEVFSVVHAAGRSNEYSLRVGTNPPVRLTSAELHRPLAGSHFWLGDLALEFLHWPDQRLIRRETTRGRNCDVLESRPGSGAPASVATLIRSWIDIESGGLIQAEAFGAQGKPWKQFEVDKLTKVNDVWRVSRMEMRATNRALSVIEFQFKDK